MTDATTALDGLLPPEVTTRRGDGATLPRGASTALLAVAGLALWHVAAVVFFPDGDTLPRPTDVVRAFADNRDIWWSNTWATLVPALKGLGAGIAIAALLAALTMIAPFTERPVLRVAVAVYSLPIVAVGPVLQVSLSGDAPASALAALSVVFTTLVALVIGLRAVPPNSGDIARALGAPPLRYFLKVRVPSALPSFFAALRVAFPAAVIGSMIGEFMGAPRGLAVLMIGFVDDLDTAATWATGAVITFLTTIGFLVIGMVGKVATRWIPATAPAGRTAVPRGWLRRASGSLVTLGVSAGALLVGWMAYLRLFDINSFVGKGPSDVWRFLTEPTFAEGRSEVFAALNRTLLDAGVGLLVGWVLAIGLACAFVLSPTVERVVMPVALAFRSVPILAVLPLLTLIFGRDLLGTIVIVLIIVFFPTLVLVLQALRSVPADLVAVSHAYNASSATLLRKVRMPLALPSMFASLRIACPSAVLGALLAEWLATGKGMGYLLLRSTTQSDYQKLWTGTVVMTTVAVLAYTVVDALERLVIGRFADPAR
jgi:sulfonate transport system permease protein